MLVIKVGIDHEKLVGKERRDSSSHFCWDIGGNIANRSSNKSISVTERREIFIE